VPLVARAVFPGVKQKVVYGTKEPVAVRSRIGGYRGNVCNPLQVIARQERQCAKRPLFFLDLQVFVDL
jgi:hypothetical protein